MMTFKKFLALCALAVFALGAHASLKAYDNASSTTRVIKKPPFNDDGPGDDKRKKAAPYNGDGPAIPPGTTGGGK